MSADDGTDSRADPGRQRTVAELLAEHGGGKAGGSRRRRRAPDDDDEQAPAVGQTGGVEVESTGAVGRERSRVGDTRSQAAPKQSAPQQAAPQQTAPQQAQPPRAQPPQVPEQRWAGATGYGQSIDPLTGEPIDTPSGQTFGSPPANNGQGVTGSRSMPLTRTDPPTEELPQYQERSWASRVKDAGPLTGPITGTAATGTAATRTGATGTAATGTGATRTGATGTAATRAGATGTAATRTGATRTGATGAVAGPPTGQVSPADLFDESDSDDLDDDEAWGRRASAAPAGLAERGERGEILDEHEDDEDDEEYDEPDERPEGVTGWLGLIAQWVVGAVAGALLWVGFSYLWMHVPVVALIAAVAATAALVLVVRAIRRSDDLQTTMLAVLVGLVVTISPAVLLLAVR